jgi:hypothetical protein
MENFVDELKRLLEDPEEEKKIQDYFDKIAKKHEIENNQIERAHAKFDERFEEIIEKIITKYHSKKYKGREYDRGYEPREELFFFLLKYAEKYGRECESKEEFLKYGNTFTAELYYYKGYYFNLMIGQGSCVLIFKEEK